MAYTLQAVIGRMEHLLAASLPGVKLVRLPQEMGLIPISTVVQSRWGIPFLPLTDEGETTVPSGLGDLMQPLFGGGPVAYVEAEFWGGDGTQAYILWDVKKQHSTVIVHPYAINEALRHLGVEAAEETDEFDAIDLGRHRYTDDWEEDAIAEHSDALDGSAARRRK